MTYEAKVILKSVSPTGIELTTIEVCIPDIVHPQLIRHRAISPSVQSDRAVPLFKLIKQVMDDPYIPERWPKQGPGMVPQEYLTDPKLIERAEREWLAARDQSILSAQWLNAEDIGVHKEICNRLLHPWKWRRMLLTATEWGNFFNLRIHGDAQDPMRKIAEMIYEAKYYSDYHLCDYGEWHLPYMTLEDREQVVRYTSGDEPQTTYTLKNISAARCARVSFLNHDGVRELDKDIALAGKLVTKGDMSPFEHQATPLPKVKRHSTSDPSERWCANLYGWRSFRKEIPNENRREYVGPLEEVRESDMQAIRDAIDTA